MSYWTTPARLLLAEMIQRRDEGCVVPDDLAAAITALGREAAASPVGTVAWTDPRIEEFYRALGDLPVDEALAAREPDGLEAIRALRPAGPRDLHWEPGEIELLDRMHGAWTGRCMGCVMGKPIEGIGLSTDESGQPTGPQRVRNYLTARGQWPLEDYVSGADADDGMQASCFDSQLEQVAYAPADDDLHYSLVGLGVLEQHGLAFQWYDVARYWLEHIPIPAICTAEAQAIHTFMCHTTRSGREVPGHLTPEVTRMHWNPYREWIGAQIRSDGWGWACAGWPERAAELAYRDACWTHSRNGIYGEMMMAAMQAAAFAEPDLRRVVDIGLSEIPADCRLARAVRQTLDWLDDGADYGAAVANVLEYCGHMNPVHTINNMMICIVALLRGERMIEKTCGLAVMAGLDTDCNGASVGSILGARLGKRQVSGPVPGRLNDTLKPRMVGMPELRLTDLAARHAELFHLVRDPEVERGER